ncbi:hypothetical protein, partial [Mesorhizobium sp.]|uniref:hypothetical protein n=1 Tax=Mesorhizobium sp. TaxID=1871066 RepID=UPI00257C6388
VFNLGNRRDEIDRMVCDADPRFRPRDSETSSTVVVARQCERLAAKVICSFEGAASQSPLWEKVDAHETPSRMSDRPHVAGPHSSITRGCSRETRGAAAFGEIMERFLNSPWRVCRASLGGDACEAGAGLVKRALST